MEERNDAFDSAIREKLSGHEPAVPHALWTRISAELNDSEQIAAPVAAPQIQAPVASTPWWRVAAAAAVVITVGAASLLFTIQPRTEAMPTAAAKPATNNNVVAPATVVVQDAAQIAVVAAPAATKRDVAPAPKQEVSAAANTVTANNTENATKDVAAPATNDSDIQLAAAPAVTPSTTMDLGNIPAFSLKRLSAPESLNDEITIIKSSPSKKKHRKHGEEEESTRVIILNKKFDSQPGIRYQLPVRF